MCVCIIWRFSTGAYQSTYSVDQSTDGVCSSNLLAPFQASQYPNGGVLRDECETSTAQYCSVRVTPTFGGGNAIRVTEEEQLAGHRRQEVESLGAYAADVKLCNQAGSQITPLLALHAFLQGLTPEQLRQHVCLTRPESLFEALRKAERAEVDLSNGPSQPPSATSRPHVRQADCEEGLDGAEEVCKAWARPADRCCHWCVVPNHTHKANGAFPLEVVVRFAKVCHGSRFHRQKWV